MMMAFRDEKERILALNDLIKATETFFRGNVNDRELAVADGVFARERRRNRTGNFYVTTADTESSAVPTGDPRRENAA